MVERLQALYLVYIAKTKKETKLDTFTQMLYNNLLSLPFIVLLVVVLELPDGLLEFQYWLDPGFIVCFVMSSVLAFLLNWFIFLCSTINSPLTTSVTGQIKTIATTVIGFFTFDDVVSSDLMVAGLFVRYNRRRSLSVALGALLALLIRMSLWQTHPSARLPASGMRRSSITNKSRKRTSCQRPLPTLAAAPVVPMPPTFPSSRTCSSNVIRSRAAANDGPLVALGQAPSGAPLCLDHRTALHIYTCSLTLTHTLTGTRTYILQLHSCTRR